MLELGGSRQVVAGTLSLACDGGAPPRERPIVFLRPLIGFPSSRRFEIRSLGAQYMPFAALGSLDEADVTFVVAPPGVLYPGYRLEIPETEVGLLGLSGPDDAEVLVLVACREGTMPTANLMGPVIVKISTDEAVQVVLEESGYTVAVDVDADIARSDLKAPPTDPGPGPREGS